MWIVEKFLLFDVGPRYGRFPKSVIKLSASRYLPFMAE